MFSRKTHYSPGSKTTDPSTDIGDTEPPGSNPISGRKRHVSGGRNGPLNIKWENAFIQTSYTGTLPQTFTSRTRSDAIIQPGYGISELPGNSARLRVLDITGTKFIVDRVENPKDNTTFPEDRYKIIAKK